MWFRNFQLYRFVDSFSLSEQELAEKLEEQRFKPCDRQAKETVGWISPLHRKETELVYAANGCFLLCMRKEQKVIPPTMVNEALEERVAIIEQEQGRKVFRKEKQQFKEDIMAMLLPKAFTRASHTLGYIDTRNGFMVINAGSHSQADTFISLIIDSLGVLGAVKFEAEENPSVVMNRWLLEGLPENFSLTGEYELKDMLDEREAKFKDNEAENQVIGDLLQDGYWVNKLGVYFHEYFKCQINADLSIKSVKFSDELIKESDDIEAEDKMARWDADFVLMTQTIAQFVKEFSEAFSISK